MKRPTQSDVARLANVSRATVSMVLRGQVDQRIPISEETRRRVLEAAQQLGYAPNLAAQMLAGGTNRLIGVFTYERFFPYEADDFYYPFLLGIERQASKEEYDLLLFTRTHGSGHPSVYRNGSNTLGLVAGSILLGSTPNRNELKKIAGEGNKFVYIGRREVEDVHIDWVSSDYKTASHEATTHLLELGHRNLGFLGGSPVLSESMNDRLSGCLEAVESHPDVTLHVLKDHHDSYERVVVEYVKQRRITALICGNMGIFSRVYDLLKKNSFNVPQDISLVALGDGLEVGVKPTGVNTHRQEVGEAAVKLLISKISGESQEPRQVYVPCSFNLGETSGPPPEFIAP